MDIKNHNTDKKKLVNSKQFKAAVFTETFASYEAIDSALVIHLPKEVDHHNCLTLKYETDLLLAENYINRIIFDFSGTEFMDSSGIGVILNRYKQMEGSSGTVAVYGAGERMRRILRIGGVYRLVQSYRTREEALDGRH